LTISTSSDAASFWYSDANYSNLIISAASFETAKLKSDTVFYVEAVSTNGCISRDTVKVTVYSLPELTVSDITVCYDSTAVLTISSSDAVSFAWYSDANYFNLIINAASFETAKLKSDTVFYAEAVSANGCISRDTVHVTVYSLPELTVSDITVCYDSTAVLTALSSDAASFAWYSDANYSNLIINSASFETAKLKSDTVFYTETVSVNGCISRDTVHVTVYSLPELTVSDITVCYDSTAVFTG
jgi:uncharacterized protein YjbI with pentapeptide repeats